MMKKRDSGGSMFIIHLFLIGIFGFGIYAGLQWMADAHMRIPGKLFLLLLAAPVLFVIILLINTIEIPERDTVRDHRRKRSKAQIKPASQVGKSAPPVAEQVQIQREAKVKAFQEKLKERRQRQAFWLEQKRKRTEESLATAEKKFNEDFNLARKAENEP